MRGASGTGIDLPLLSVVLALVAVSFLMVYSSAAILSQEHYGNNYTMLLRHAGSVGIGGLLMLLVSRLPISRLRRVSGLAIVVSLVLLVVVFVPGLGKVSGGAQRWLVLGPFRFQPSEFVKLLVVIYFASYIFRHEKKMFRMGSGIIVPMFVVGTVASLLLMEPDFGSTVVIVGVVMGQVLMTSRISHLIGLGVGAIGSLGVLAVAAPYRWKRIEAFLDPFADPQNNGYQLIQSLIAVGSGGLWGKGLGNGEQKLYYLPAAHTDFIYAVIAEEWGFAGAVGVVFLFCYLGYRGFRLAYLLAEDSFLSSLAVGCTMLVIFPAMLNIGVVLGMLPTKGLVLPLVSYGGTAMVANLLNIGILLALSREVSHQEVQEEKTGLQVISLQQEVITPGTSATKLYKVG